MRGLGVLQGQVPPNSDHVDDLFITAGATLYHPIPEGARRALFSFEHPFRLKFGNESTPFSYPTQSSATGNGSLFNPSMTTIPAGATHLVLASKTDNEGNVEFFG